MIKIRVTCDHRGKFEGISRRDIGDGDNVLSVGEARKLLHRWEFLAANGEDLAYCPEHTSAVMGARMAASILSPRWPR